MVAPFCFYNNYRFDWATLHESLFYFFQKDVSSIFNLDSFSSRYYLIYRVLFICSGLSWAGGIAQWHI